MIFFVWWEGGGGIIGWARSRLKRKGSDVTPGKLLRGILGVLLRDDGTHSTGQKVSHLFSS